MINFPTIIVDNFYKEPDKVREFALKQDFLDSPGNYPGKRTKQLYELNRDLFIGFCTKLFSLYYPSNIQWVVNTAFWKVGSIDSIALSPKNMGWIHDDGCLFAGVVYLTPDLNSKLGTNIYKQIKEREIIDTSCMHKFYSSGIDDNFDENITKNNSAFEETTRICNAYNRLVCFDGRVPHSPSNYFMGDEIRLVQVFFVREIHSPVPTPIQRIRDYDNIPYDSL
jgi:hypothetical protein